MQCKYNLYNWKNDVSGLSVHQVCTGAFRETVTPEWKFSP